MKVSVDLFAYLIIIDFFIYHTSAWFMERLAAYTLCHTSYVIPVANGVVL